MKLNFYKKINIGKKKEGYVEQPNHQSQRQMMQERKFYAKKDEVFLSDIFNELENSTSNPCNHFKDNRKISLKQEEMYDKVGVINF